MSEKTIFKQIIDKEIPADIVYEDPFSLAFNDINPQAPVHVVLIPKQEVRSLLDTVADDQLLLGHLLRVVRKLSIELGLKSGFRTVINTGPDGGQTVDHLHLHILGKRKLNWPPG